jgi:hypothetical protein
MNCKEPKCVYSKKYKKCVLPNPYIEALSECKRNNIKKKDCYINKELAKEKACKNYKTRVGLSSSSLPSNVKNRLEEIKKNINARKITKKFKEFMIPFINRISANLQFRINYYLKVVKILNELSNEQCLNLYNQKDGNKQYTIGKDNQILLSKQIGTTSKNGIIYLSKINIEHKTLYKFAIKLMTIKNFNKDEIPLLKKLSDLTLKNVNPHFPILYKLFQCNQRFEPLNVDNYAIILSELADGDLKTFIIHNKEYHTNDELVKNTMQQILLSILSFHIHTNYIHMDAHWGNFLYHKIKPGGYIHYKIYNEDIYIKNMGYLWIIWDYIINKKEDEKYLEDYSRIKYAFKNGNIMKDNNLYDGWVHPDLFKYSNNIKKIVTFIFPMFLKNKKCEKKSWKTLLTTELFINEHKKPPDNEIINFGNPYILK